MCKLWLYFKSHAPVWFNCFYFDYVVCFYIYVVYIFKNASIKLLHLVISQVLNFVPAKEQHTKLKANGKKKRKKKKSTIKLSEQRFSNEFFQKLNFMRE